MISPQSPHLKSFDHDAAVVLQVIIKSMQTGEFKIVQKESQNHNGIVATKP